MQELGKIGRFASVYNHRVLWLQQKLHKPGPLFVFPEVPPLLHTPAKPRQIEYG